MKTKKTRAKPSPKPKTVLVLRTVDKDRKAHGGFQWPEKGPVQAQDWDPTPECGRGLHGWLKGEGDGSLGNWSVDALWQVVEVAEKDIVPLGGKVKFPKGEVVFTGARDKAIELIRASYPGAMVIGATVTAGDNGTATAGHYGTATAGDGGTATAGAYGTATAGDNGTATAGRRGTATAGDGGTATAGDNGTATAGYGGTATAGYGGTIVLRYWDGNRNRYRLVVGYPGEDGIEAGKKYRLDASHKFVEVPPASP